MFNQYTVFITPELEDANVNKLTKVDIINLFKDIIYNAYEEVYE